MAKITAMFDTVDKTLACSVDDKAIADVHEVHVSRGYGEDGKYGCSLTTLTQDEDEGTMHMTRLMASLAEDGAVTFTRVETEHKSKVQEDIEKFFGVA